MSNAVVQSRGAFSNGTQTVSLAFSSNNTVHNTLFYVGLCSNTGTLNSNPPTDNNTNTITSELALNLGSTGQTEANLARVKDCHAGACTVTQTSPGASEDIHISIWEVSGLDLTAAVVTTGNNAQAVGTTTYTVSTAGSANAGDFVIAAHYANNTGANAFVLASGYDNTSKILNQNGTGGDSSFIQAKLSASSGVQTASGSMTSDSCGSIIASFKTAAAAGVVTADGDPDLFPKITSPLQQSGQELQDTFAIQPPSPPPFAFEDDGTNMRWSDYRTLQYDETDFPRSLPPTPPIVQQDEHPDEKNVDWTARQYDDTETHRALPPTPPSAIQDEISERFGGQTPYPFVEFDQPGIPIVVQAAPNIGLDDLESMTRAFDRIIQYDHIQDTDEPGFLGAPPFAIQEEDPQKSFAWTATAYDHTAETDEPGSISAPPLALQDDDPQRVFSWTGFHIEEDSSAFPPIVAAIPPSSVQEDDLIWRGVTSQFIEADWSTTALPPPIAYEDDLKTFSADVRSRQDEEIFVGIPPVPPIVFTAVDDDLYFQKWGVTGFASLITIDEYVGVPIVTPGPFVGISGKRAFASMMGGTSAYSQMNATAFRPRQGTMATSSMTFSQMLGTLRVVPTMIYRNLNVISRGINP